MWSISAPSLTSAGSITAVRSLTLASGPTAPRVPALVVLFFCYIKYKTLWTGREKSV